MKTLLRARPNSKIFRNWTYKNILYLLGSNVPFSIIAKSAKYHLTLINMFIIIKNTCKITFWLKLFFIKLARVVHVLYSVWCAMNYYTGTTAQLVSIGWPAWTCWDMRTYQILSYSSSVANMRWAHLWYNILILSQKYMNLRIKPILYVTIGGDATMCTSLCLVIVGQI